MIPNNPSKHGLFFKIAFSYRVWQTWRSVGHHLRCQNSQRKRELLIIILKSNITRTTVSSHFVFCQRRPRCVVIVHHRLWLCLRLTKGAQTCVHGAQDADILPWLSLVDSQSLHTLQHLRVEQLHLLFHEGGRLLFLFAHSANQAI